MSKIAAVIFCSILSVALLGFWAFQRTVAVVPSAQSAPERKPVSPQRHIVKIALVSGYHGDCSVRLEDDQETGYFMKWTITEDETSGTPFYVCGQFPDGTWNFVSGATISFENIEGELTKGFRPQRASFRYGATMLRAVRPGLVRIVAEFGSGKDKIKSETHMLLVSG